MSRKNINILINKVARASKGQLKQSVKTAYTNGNGIDKKRSHFEIKHFIVYLKSNYI